MSECKRSDYQRRWRKANPEKTRAQARRANYKRLYGITPADAERLWAEQGGLCRCCGTELYPPSHEKYHGSGVSNVDHCHKTGKIRGILCWHCNTGIGKLGDSVAGVKQALAYLEACDER
jgi:hypothetical protein